MWSFVHGKQRSKVELLTDAAPARCAELLAQKQVDAALVPVIEYQRIPDIQVVPGVCVGSHAAVRSVVLVTKTKSLQDIQSVALDSSSRTSQVLAKILFREFLKIEPQWKLSNNLDAGLLVETDAVLVIGDPAMRPREPDFHVFDLVSLWRGFTGLGFVFAMWMAQASAVEVVKDLD
ncbi:MAG TPA: MqnA/MqnD/SBP family protein, partial [Pyrinomonadaceae bacterium]|nr:MqnA/MqnD/SBP family protein [Pyrinomonadaceae bacterium]